jgi:hypothetical protein
MGSCGTDTFRHFAVRFFVSDGVSVLRVCTVFVKQTILFISLVSFSHVSVSVVFFAYAIVLV